MKNEVASNYMHDQAIDAFLADILQMKVMLHDKMNAIYNVRIIYSDLMISL